MKLLIVAGGGGHFAPALAVIEQLPKDWDVLVVGRKYTFEGDKTESLEFQTAKKLGIKFTTITTGRLQRQLTRHSLQSLIKVPVGFFQALQILKDYNPDVVLSFGGYVSLPVAFAARMLGIPIVVHEQILGAGLANKIVAKFAEKVCISWKQSAKFFPREKVVLTGNPVRKGQREESIAYHFDEKLPMVYVTGGSGGAHAINVLIEACLEKLLKKYTLIHQTGDAKEFADFDRLEKKKDLLPKTLQSRYFLTKFVASGQVFAFFEKADLVVARSGMNTVTELLSYGKPCLLIPLPYGQHNEQLTNALFVKQTGIAEVGNQKDLTGEKLYKLITNMIDDLINYKNQSKKAQFLITKESAQKIIAVVKYVNEKRKLRNRKQLFIKISVLGALLFVGVMAGYFTALAIFVKHDYISPLAKTQAMDDSHNAEKAEIFIREALTRQSIGIKSITLQTESYKIILKDDVEVILSSEKDLSSQISSLQFILQRLTMEGTLFSQLDLRFDKPVIKLR